MTLGKPGRPKNPYNSAPWGIVPRACDEWLVRQRRGGPRIETSAEPDFIPGVAAAIEGILEADLPRPRRYIHDLLVFNYRVHPLDVTAALEVACSRAVIVTPVTVSGDPRPSHIYSCRRPPTQSELGALTRMMQQAREHMSPQRLGDVAEWYVYGVLRRSGAYKLPQRQKIGEIRDSSGKNKIDIVAERKSDRRRFAISIKNERRFVTSGHRAFPDVIEMAAAHNAAPWLVASYLTPEAKRHAVRHGVRYTELGRQILPRTTAAGKNMRLAVEKLRHVIGPARFEYVPMNRFPSAFEWDGDEWNGVGLDAWTIPDDVDDSGFSSSIGSTD